MKTAKHIKLKKDSGEQGRNDGLQYEMDLKTFLHEEHDNNRPDSILNDLCVKKYSTGFENKTLECYNIGMSKQLISENSARKTTSKIDLFIYCPKIDKKINFSIKKNHSGFQYHITTANRFFDIITEKHFNISNLEILKSAVYKFLGCEQYSPDFLLDNKKITLEKYNKLKGTERFLFSELTNQEQKVLKDFFKDKENLIKLVSVFLLGKYKEDADFVDFIVFNTTNYNDKNRTISPKFINQKDLMTYLESNINNKNFIAFNETTIHFGNIFSLQRKGSGKSKGSRSTIQFKGKNLIKLDKDIQYFVSTNNNLAQEDQETPVQVSTPEVSVEENTQMDIKEEQIPEVIVEEKPLEQTPVFEEKVISVEQKEKEKDLHNFCFFNEKEEVKTSTHNTIVQDGDYILEVIAHKIIEFRTRFIKGCKAFWSAFNEKV